MFRSKAEQKVVEAGLRPGPAAARPVLDREVAGAARGLGPVDRPRHVDVPGVLARSRSRSSSPGTQLNALPRTEHTQDIHCVTRWSKFDMTFSGIHWRELEELVQPKPRRAFAIAHSEQGYTANVPISFLRRARAAGDACERRAARRRARLPAPARDPGQVLLEERQVAARDRALGGRPAGLLGALRLQQRRRPLERRAVRLLARPQQREEPPGEAALQGDGRVLTWLSEFDVPSSDPSRE